MEKDYVFIKANGIRKELQETNKLLKRIAKAIEQSNKLADEKSKPISLPVVSYDNDDVLWRVDTTDPNYFTNKQELSGNSSPEKE